MNKNIGGGNRDFFGNIFLVLIGAVVGYTCFEIMQHYTAWFALPFFMLDVLIVLVLIYDVRRRYLRLMQAFIYEAAENVRKISKGEEMDKPKTGLFSQEITEFYETIDTLSKSLITQNHYKDNVLGIINSIALNIELEKLLDDMLPKIIEGTGSNWGAFYLYNHQTEKMELKSSIGFSKKIYSEFDIALGDGFIGNSALTDEIKIFNDIPDDTIYISKTFLGKIKPRSVMTVPIRTDGETVASLLLASIYNYNDDQIEIVKLIRYYMGSAVTNGVTFERTKRLKNELLFQNQLIQNMNEELENKVEERAEYLNNVLNSITDYSIVSMDEGGYIQKWNKGAEEIRGCAEKDVIGKHISEIHSESADISLSRIEAAKRDGKYEDIKWHNMSDGRRLYMHRVITAVYNSRGVHTGFTSVTRDMTEYKLLNDKTYYWGVVCDLLLADRQAWIIVVNGEGIILCASGKAAEICNSPREELEGELFSRVFEDCAVLNKKLEACFDGLGTQVWDDYLKINNNIIYVNISLSEISKQDAPEKIACAYIEENSQNLSDGRSVI